MTELDELIQYWKDYCYYHRIAMTYPIGWHIKATLRALEELKTLKEAQP